MKVSVLIPVYNEEATITQVVSRVMALPYDKEVILIDDASTDGTAEALAILRVRHPEHLLVRRHTQRQGKGAAIRTGLELVTGDVIVIQHADLEYHPEDYPAALRLVENNWADAVYGSRFLGPHRVFPFRYQLANKGLTFISNLLTSGILTDVETGFKVIRADVFRQLDVQSLTTDFDVEVTVKLFRYGYRVYEIPITYTGGDRERKHFTWRSGVRRLGALGKWGISTRRRRAAVAQSGFTVSQPEPSKSRMR